MLNSEAWKSLNPVQRALFIEIVQRYNGFNNGSIGLGVVDAGRALHIKAQTAGAAFHVLMERGFIVLTKDSSFDQKKLVREFRVTCLSLGTWDAPTAPPTHDYMRWRPPGQKQKPVPFGDNDSAVWGQDPLGNEPETAPTVCPNGTEAAPHSAVPGQPSIYQGDIPLE